MNTIESFARYLIQNAESISREIIQFNIEKLEIAIPAEIVDRAVIRNREFMIFLGETLNQSDDTVEGQFVEWHKGLMNQSESEYSIENIASLIKPYAETRLRLNNMLTRISMEQGLSTEDVVFVNSRASYLLDLSITETIIERERITNEQNNKNQKVITELSSPVVPIQNGLAILPLIGDLDLDRSEHIMDHVVPKISKMNIECLIIDFSGIAAIDAEVASRIFKLYDVLGLLGINAIFTGIRPELATRIITAGIDFSSFTTFGTVQQAIEKFHII
ncbi:STAS domain-containing protein [Peribacillus sp. SCS-155]|uniref:STAS domain-containing protein n=1 Tax=Peribacillus sedimenti TaxID=3115297 RepID=UPI0039060A17